MHGYIPACMTPHYIESRWTRLDCVTSHWTNNHIWMMMPYLSHIDLEGVTICFAALQHATPHALRASEPIHPHMDPYMLIKVPISEAWWSMPIPNLSRLERLSMSQAGRGIFPSAVGDVSRVHRSRCSRCRSHWLCQLGVGSSTMDITRYLIVSMVGYSNYY